MEPRATTIANLRRQVARQQRLLEMHERERDEVHHRVANNLSLAAAMLARQGRQASNKSVEDALRAASARIQGIVALHRYLYRHGSHENIDLADFLHELCPVLEASVGLGCSAAADRLTITGDLASRIAIVVTELAVNARKHAYGETAEGKVSIAARANGTAKLVITVRDGGMGLPEDFDPKASPGIGFSVISSMLQAVGGEMRAENDGGAVFILTFPLE